MKRTTTYWLLSEFLKELFKGCTKRMCGSSLNCPFFAFVQVSGSSKRWGIWVSEEGSLSTLAPVPSLHSGMQRELEVDCILVYIFPFRVMFGTWSTVVADAANISRCKVLTHTNVNKDKYCQIWSRIWPSIARLAWSNVIRLELNWISKPHESAPFQWEWRDWIRTECSDWQGWYIFANPIRRHIYTVTTNVVMHLKVWRIKTRASLGGSSFFLTTCNLFLFSIG